MHILPQLRRLEGKFQNELAVIGVHSAKFPTEKSTANLRQAVLRYDIRHPVINDRDFTVWEQYAARAWPTLYLIDPQGKVLGRHEGEFRFEDVDNLVGAVIQEFDRGGLMDRTPLRWRLEREAIAAGRALAFPGKVLAEESPGRLFISDSGHHRMVVASLDGVVQQVIGSGEAGFQDGAFATARFSNPQGAALWGDALYVADTDNHAIRRVDLARGQITTVAGMGGQSLVRHNGGVATAVRLSSPWDVAVHDRFLFVAMSGMHQLWAYDPNLGEVAPFAGSGHEGLQDGPPRDAWLAQPSGLASDGQHLYFADSETSSIRSVTLGQGARVSTIVGVDLFAFGDVDGVGEEARLQHPLGLCHHDGVLYVADTYNHKVKRVIPHTRTATTFLGDGQPGRQDGQGQTARLYEPGGLSVAGGKLYIADTNNHAIRVADLETGVVRTMGLRGL